MATIKRPGGSGTFGVKPTAAQKLAHVADKQGLPGIAGMQGSTVNLFDTQILTASSQSATYTFFKNTSQKAQQFTNFQTGQLKAGETIVIEEVCFFLYTLSAATYADSTQITAITSLTQNSQLFPIYGGTMTLNISNQDVVKDLHMTEAHPLFNGSNRGIASIASGDSVIGDNVIELENMATLLPGQGISLTITVPPIPTITGNIALVARLGRFGSIYASKTTL